MNDSFKPVSMEQKSEYDAFWALTPVHSLDYTLTNLWGWQEYYALGWHFDNSLCWIRQDGHDKANWAPLGDWKNTDWERAMALACPAGAEFIRVPEALVDIWKEALPGRVLVHEERGQWEYLYSRDELASLSGNRFHKKRNHYNSFINAYGQPDYRPLDDSTIRNVLDLQDDWCKCHECDDSPSLLAENEAIKKIIANWEQFGNLVGGGIFVENQMAAFSVGEKLDDESLGVHFEKGLTAYKGIYQTMNCEFARHAGEGFKYINRAQDLDEEGLRQAKMTYHPVDFLRKYRVEILPA